MCGTATKTNNTMGWQSGVQSTTLPAWATAAGQNIYDQSAAYSAANPYEAYSGPTEGTFGPQFGTATDYATGTIGKTNPFLSSADLALKQVYGNASDTANSSVQDLMSPYTEGVLAPTLTAIDRNAAAKNNQTTAAATMEGAFGDSGYGVQRGLNDSETQRNIADATAAGYNTAFNNAQTQKNNALQELLSAASGFTSAGNADSSSKNTLASLLANMGSTAEKASESGITNDMLVNNEQNTGQINRFSALQNILRGAPMDTTTTSVGNSIGYGTATQPDNTGLNVASNLFGRALFGGSNGSGSGASPSAGS